MPPESKFVTTPPLPEPPIAPQRPHTWERPGGAVDDPYAWLADRDDPATIDYLTAENAHADAYLGTAERAELVETLFGEIKSRVQETDLSVPTFHGGWWYISRTIEGAAYPTFSRSRVDPTVNDDDDGSAAGETVFVDANAEAEGSDYFEIGALEPSPDHRLLAWSTDLDGSELFTLRVRRFPDVADGQQLDLADAIERTSSWGGVAWSGDGEHLFYARPDAQMRPHEIWRHRLGTPVDDDELVLAETDQRFNLGVDSTRSGRWILIEARSSTTSEVHVIDAADPTAAPRLVRERVADVEYALDDRGDDFVVLTNLDAPDFRVMTAPHDAPDDWTELVAHEPGRRIVGVEPFATHVVIHEWADAQQQLRLLHADGTVAPIDFGDEPHDIGPTDNPEWDTTTLRIAYQSMTTPASVYDVDVVTGERQLRKRTPTPGVDLDRYVAERQWAKSPDGTLVPVDIVRHIDTDLDGTAPGVVYAYGAYEVSFAPWFSVGRISLLDRGVVFALAHPRGGGELGRRWYLEGKLLNKRNTFTDVLAVADHLATSGVVDGSRLAVRGASAGGLMLGACVTMRPDRFSTAVAEVPFVDVVNTMSDPTLPLTTQEWEEWGDPRSEPFASYIAGYSPYDNTSADTVGGDASKWPALYVTAGLNDPRVGYHEPAKWVARLRAAGAGSHAATGRPLVLRVDMGAGHGGPSGRYDTWRDEARVLAFLLDTL